MSGEGEVPTGVEEQVGSAEALHDASPQARQDDLCREVGRPERRDMLSSSAS